MKTTIDKAPTCLNMNDKAMWVTGWNEAIASMEAQPESEPVASDTQTNGAESERRIRSEMDAVGRQQPFEILIGSGCDSFSGSNTALVAAMVALLKLDAAGALTPHGIGGHARTLLTAAVSRLAEPAQPESEPTHTTGHCKEKAKPGGCQLHNLQCNYPACDRKVAQPEGEPGCRVCGSPIGSLHMAAGNLKCGWPARVQASDCEPEGTQTVSTPASDREALVAQLRELVLSLFSCDAEFVNKAADMLEADAQLQKLYEQREEEAHQLSEQIIKIKADREDLAGLNMKQGDALMQLAAERDALKADALRYRGLRQMCVQLSLSNDTTAMLLKDQSELDSTMKEGAK